LSGGCCLALTFRRRGRDVRAAVAGPRASGVAVVALGKCALAGCASACSHRPVSEALRPRIGWGTLSVSQLGPDRGCVRLAEALGGVVVGSRLGRNRARLDLVGHLRHKLSGSCSTVWAAGEASSGVPARRATALRPRSGRRSDFECVGGGSVPRRNRNAREIHRGPSAKAARWSLVFNRPDRYRVRRLRDHAPRKRA
jgi:hypothetical protein